MTTDRIAVLGASGLTGDRITHRLLEEGYHVVAPIHRKPLAMNHPHCTTPTLDWEQKGALAALLQQASVRVVISAMPLWHTASSMESVMADLLPGSQLRHLIAFSSTSIEGKARSQNRNEQQVVQQLQHAEAHLINLAATHDYLLTILRPTMIYGYGRDGNVARIAAFMRRFHCYPVYRRAQGKRTPVHVDDLAQAIMQILHQTSPLPRTIYTLCGGEVLSYHEMVQRIAMTIDRPVSIFKVPALPLLMDMAGYLMPGLHVTGEMARRMEQDLVFHDQSARQDFGYAPRPFTFSAID